MNALVKHIEELNAKTQAWVDANPGSWAGMITTDLDHWAEYGIHTVEDFERYQLETSIYEGHKDAFGVKGRHYDFASMTIEQLREEAAWIDEQAQAAYEREKAQEEAGLVSFKELVQRTIEMGAGDEETALRWLTQNDTFYHGQDVEHWVWEKGILFTDYGRKLVKRLESIVTFAEWEAA